MNTSKGKGEGIMPNKTIDARAFCPFYIRENKTSIVCEGILGSHTRHIFESETEKKTHEKDFCTSKNCKNCIYHRLKINQYEKKQEYT